MHLPPVAVVHRLPFDAKHFQKKAKAPSGAFTFFACGAYPIAVIKKPPRLIGGFFITGGKTYLRLAGASSCCIPESGLLRARSTSTGAAT